MLYIVVPAYNEGKVIKSTLLGLSEYKVIVVDDCSTDNTSEIAREFCEVVKHQKNLGQGAALRTGIAHALSKGATKIVTFDSDGQHDPNDIPKINEMLNTHDVVLGSRFLGQTSNLPTTRKVMLKGSVLLCKLFYGLKLTDSHNGLRGFTADAAKRIKITENRMLHASEILQRISEQKLSYTEVPVHIRYTEYSLEKGQSMWNAFRIFKGMIKLKIYSKQA